jgi:hypothetical protein
MAVVGTLFGAYGQQKMREWARAACDHVAKADALAKAPCAKSADGVHQWRWQRAVFDPNGKYGLGTYECRCGASKLR